MTKEIDLLSLSKNTENKTSNTNTKAEKKEGLSLFDSLIVNNQKDANAKEETNLKNDSTPKENLSKEEESSTTKKSDTDETKSQTKNTQSSNSTENKEDIKADTSKTKTDETKENKTNTKANSLLDRMILESKTNVKTLNKEELSTNKIEKNTNSENSENKLDTKVSNENIKTQNTEANNSDTKTIKAEKAPSSLLDKMISDAKTVIKDEKNIESSEKTLKVGDTANTELTKEIAKEVKSDDKTLGKEIKPEVKSSEINTKEDIKISSESKVVNTNTVVDSEEKKDIKVENKIDTPKVEASKLEVTDSKNLNDIKNDIKIETTNPKETIKENSTIVEDIKTNPNKNIVENNLENVPKEEKILKSDSKEIKTDIKVDLKEVDKIITSDESISKKSETTSNNKILENSNSEKRFNQDNTLENKSDKSLKNETLAKELSKIDTSSTDDLDIEVNISKKDILKETVKDNSNDSKSLMDRLLDNAKKSTIVTKENISNQTLDEQTTNTKSNDVLTNIFLGTQKKSIYDQMLSNKTEGLKIVKDATGLEDVKKSAEILDLGLKKTSIAIEPQKENIRVNKSIDNDALLDKLAFDKNSKKESMITTSLSSSTSNINTDSSEEVVSNLNVSPSLALSIQNRIIGAQQLMSSMMSDAARNMYQNYKPPVTAFRINLFPSQLGSIAILMKNDKDNAISISMNMSNSNTLDAFVENQNALKEALHKNFNTNEATFNLDFNLEDQNSNQSNNQEQENQENEKQSSTNDILESINQNQDVGEDLNYL